MFVRCDAGDAAQTAGAGAVAAPLRAVAPGPQRPTCGCCMAAVGDALPPTARPQHKRAITGGNGRANAGASETHRPSFSGAPPDRRRRRPPPPPLLLIQAPPPHVCCSASMIEPVRHRTAAPVLARIALGPLHRRCVTHFCRYEPPAPAPACAGAHFSLGLPPPCPCLYVFRVSQRWWCSERVAAPARKEVVERFAGCDFSWFVLRADGNTRRVASTLLMGARPTMALETALWTWSSVPLLLFCTTVCRSLSNTCCRAPLNSSLASTPPACCNLPHTRTKAI